MADELADALLALMALDRFNNYEERVGDIERIQEYFHDDDPEIRNSEREAYWRSLETENRRDNN